MISFRHHLVTLVSVFLALAIGVVLGGGPLSEVGRGAGDEADRKAVSAQQRAADATSAVSYADTFATTVAPAVYADGLAGRDVAIVTLPGAETEVVEGLTAQVGAAKGRMTGVHTLQEAMLDPSEKSLVDTLGSQLVTQAGGDAAAPDATTYERIGELLGRGIATKSIEGEPVDETGQEILDSLGGAGLAKPAAGATERAPLVLVVLGDEPAGQDEDQAGNDAILAGLSRGLRAAAAGVVVVGSTASGEEGQLGRLREDEVAAQLATVDGVERALGQVTAVQALIRVLGRSAGSFGASGSDGAVPLR